MRTRVSGGVGAGRTIFPAGRLGSIVCISIFQPKPNIQPATPTDQRLGLVFQRRQFSRTKPTHKAGTAHAIPPNLTAARTPR
jgi:hypothetical protein